MTQTILINDFSLGRFTAEQFDQLEEMAVIFRDEDMLYVRFVHVTRKDSPKSRKLGYTNHATVTEGYGKFTGKKTQANVREFVNSPLANEVSFAYVDSATGLNEKLKRISREYSKSLDTAYGYLKLGNRRQSSIKKHNKPLTAFGLKNARKKYTPPERLQKKEYSQSGGTKSRKADNRQSAKPPGWRKGPKGWYFENRINRSDSKYELEDMYKEMLQGAEEISVTYPGRWEVQHRFKRYTKYRVRRWLDKNTGTLSLPSELVQIMAGAKSAGGNVRIIRRRIK